MLLITEYSAIIGVDTKLFTGSNINRRGVGRNIVMQKIWTVACVSAICTIIASCASQSATNAAPDTRTDELPQAPQDDPDLSRMRAKVIEMIPPTIIGATAAADVVSTPGFTTEMIVPDSHLRGYVDLHTHPMSHLGFGRKAMHGAPDIGMIIPSGNDNCNDDAYRATTIDQALGNDNGTHGGWGLDNTCGDYIRAGIINNAMDDSFFYKTSNVHGDHQHAGSPNFYYWPHQTSILHQQMWWEWIKRAYDGGLRVMVALTVNSETLADIINGSPPYDDQSVADIQIRETIRMVNQHDFMEIALSSVDVRRIVRSNRLAVVLGMEVDRIGNFGRPGIVINDTVIRAEIQRLHALGIRYVFPVHLIDNPFGGTAVYDLLFNLSNNHQNGYYFQVSQSSDLNINLNAGPIGGPFFGVENRAIVTVRALLEAIGFLPAPCFDLFSCPIPPGMVRCCGNYQTIVNVFQTTPAFDTYRLIPTGHVNVRGLTDNFGETAIEEMMRLGIIIDLDHMSERTMSRVIEIAENTGDGYPLVFGHNGLREPPIPGGDAVSERSAPAQLIERASALGGMFGIGSADSTPAEFIEKYRKVWAIMGDRGVAIGTDVNGFEKLPKYREECTPGQFASLSDGFYQAFGAETGLSKSQTRNRTWDYVVDCGVSHYGLMPEFLFDIKRFHGGEDVYNNLMLNADRFAQMWQKIEAVSAQME